MTGQARQGAAAIGSGPLRFLRLSRFTPSATAHCSPLRKKLLVPSAQLLFCLRGSRCACSRAFSASPYLMLKKASIPRYCATSPSSSQSPLPSGRPCLGIPPSAPLLLLSPTDPLRWARLGAPGAGRSKNGAAANGSGPLRFLQLSRLTPSATAHCSPLRKKLLVPSAQLLFCLRGSRCACSRAFSASPYLMLKKASIPRYCATSPSSSQSPLPSGRPCLGIPPSAPLLLLSPTDPLRWARLGAPGAGRSKNGAAANGSGPLRFLRLFEVEESVHTQILRHVALVVAKSAPVGTPLPGHPSLRSLAPPLPNRPTALGSVGGPRSWAVKKRGRCQWQRPLAVPSFI